VAKVRLLDPTDNKRRLDRYELIGELASGGMATVFLGRLGGVGGFQRFVAIKRLHPHLAAEEEFIEMFLDEARLAASIHHPHVVPILEVGESESGYYLVMEYIEGDTLARIMARSLAMAKPVPRPVLVRIVLDALAGLHAAHELTDPHGRPVDLVHRDVSPQNILVGVDGCSRITDFGVARAASRLSNTRADKLKGKLAYMSPEQAKAGEIDRRADVFAMGIILWEVMATKRLFKAENEAVTLNRVLSEPIPRLSQVVPSIHPAFDQVCAKALERDPDRRYQSAAEMAESLERAARTAASTSPTDLGVASPREVAAYVQGALGEDIAAQRESVRAWLAHSEPSLPKVSMRAGEMLGLPRPADVTVKVPLDREGSSSASRPRSAVSDAVPSAPRSRPRAAAADPPSEPANQPASGKRTGLAVASLISAPDEGELEPHEGVPDDDDEHETLLMDREAASAALGLVPSAPARANTEREPAKPAATPAPMPAKAAPASAPRPAFGEEGTPSASLEALALAPPPPNRTPQVVAIAVGVAIALGGAAFWWSMHTAQVTPPPTERPAAAGTPATAATSAQTAATAVQPAATVVQTAATEGSAAATTAPVVKGPLPGKPPQAKGKTEPPKQPEPKPADPKPEPPKPADLPPLTKPAEPAKPPEDMANPYR
jgi:serine/threonine-protein kinase